MLILTRRVGETIVIGDDVVVTVLGIKCNQVRWIIYPTQSKFDKRVIEQS